MDKNKELSSINEEEQRIIDMLIEGSVYKDIATALNKSVRAVKNRTEKLKDQFDSKTLPQLVYKVCTAPTFQSSSELEDNEPKRTVEIMHG